MALTDVQQEAVDTLVALGCTVIFMKLAKKVIIRYPAGEKDLVNEVAESLPEFRVIKVENAAPIQNPPVQPTQPAPTQPAPTQPAPTQPAPTQPVTTQPVTTQPVTTPNIVTPPLPQTNPSDRPALRARDVAPHSND